MKFKDTMLYSTLMAPVDTWDNTNPYYFLLLTPWILLLIVIGIPLSIIIDFFKATGDLKG